MNSKVKRLLIAALLSGSGFAVTIIWYQSTQKSLVNSGEKSLAQVGKVSDEVLRRPPTRLLWHAVNTGDPLYNGEAIRTSAAGEVRIQFEDGRFIDLEPDSLIVLSKSQGEISLDLMEGGLFVNAKSDGTGGTDQSGLVLNSAQGKVDLRGASASLSKSEGKGLNLQVVEGSAKIQSKDGKTKELTSGNSGVLGSSGMQFDSNKLKIVSPLPNKPVFIDPAKRPDIAFQWAGFPKEWKVSVWVGAGRKSLKEVSSADAGLEKLTSTLPLGHHYWKLVARDPASQEIKGESSVYRLDVLARSTPALLAPAANATIETEQFPTSVQFLWQRSEESAQLMLEVAKDSQLKQKIVTQNVDGSEKFSLPNLDAGTYYWRISSFYGDSKDTWSGPVQQFKIAKKADTKPISVQVSWEKIKAEQFYTNEPSLNLNWNAGKQTDLVAQWKVSWALDGEVDAAPESVETSDRVLATKISKPGRYIASVEAFDKQGRSMGKSEPLPVAVTPKPFLAPPQLLPLEGQIVSQADGRGELTWTSVPGAKEYELRVTSKDGKELLKHRYSNNKMTLVNLMPGEYNVKMVSVDENGRTSEKPSERSLIVPDKSNLRAPAMKKVKVK